MQGPVLRSLRSLVPRSLAHSVHSFTRSSFTRSLRSLRTGTGLLNPLPPLPPQFPFSCMNRPFEREIFSRLPREIMQKKFFFVHNYFKRKIMQKKKELGRENTITTYRYRTPRKKLIYFRFYFLLCRSTDRIRK